MVGYLAGASSFRFVWLSWGSPLNLKALAIGGVGGGLVVMAEAAIFAAFARRLMHDGSSNRLG